MVQAKFSLEESHLQFLDECRSIVYAKNSPSNVYGSLRTSTQRSTQKTKKLGS